MRIHSHKQLLDGLKHGRVWLYLNGELTLGFEWSLFDHFWHIYASFGDEREVTLSLALPRLLAIWFSIEGLFPYHWLRARRPYETGLSFHNGTLWVNILHDPTGWREGGLHRSLDFVDLFLGPCHYEEHYLYTVPVDVPMPEGIYPATVTIFESIWKRPRWFTRRMTRSDIRVEGDGIPIPGKGENDWDIEDTATMAQTSPASTPAAAVAALVRTVLLDRERYSNPAWQKPIPKDIV